VRGGVAAQALQPLGDLQQLPVAVVLLYHLLEARNLGKGLLQGQLRIDRKELHQLLHLAEGDLHGPRDVPDDLLGVIEPKVMIWATFSLRTSP